MHWWDLPIRITSVDQNRVILKCRLVDLAHKLFDELIELRQTKSGTVLEGNC